jgi:glycosyltransferase involved in cell wall biosynthesis
VDLLKRCAGNLQSELSLLRYIGESGFRESLPGLHRMIHDRENAAPVQYGLVDVLAQLGSERELRILERVHRKAAKASPSEASGPFVEFLEASLREMKQRPGEPRITPEAPTLLQCMFYGDLLLPGQAGGGGLTTFLNSLGNNLSRGEEWEAVYTLVLLPLKQRGLQSLLFQESGDGHFVVRVPVSFPATDLSREFAAHEYEIMRSVRRTLERYRIDPDLIHLRYSDNASRGVTTLAKQLRKKVVFTLTPDPHRNFVDRKGTFVSLSDENTIRDMNKVFIADSIVEHADGLVLIGHHRQNDQILPYFPQLWLDSRIREKPLRIIAEGVRSSFSYMDDTRADSYIDLLLHHEGRYRLARSALDGPLILNVGRLDPLKGQHHLLQAWAESDLSDRFCLVLIGGNAADPDPVETEMLEHIDRCMEEHRHLRGRFCHVPALPNPNVRLLERSIFECMRGPYPSVYACSSFKEEFGISILEAMVSGFLAVAPQNGGVKSYIEDGKTGFLIPTENADAIRRALERVLDPKQHSAEELREIARRGRALVKETFNIKRIAGDFSDFYRTLMEG